MLEAYVAKLIKQLLLALEHLVNRTLRLVLYLLFVFVLLCVLLLVVV